MLELRSTPDEGAPLRPLQLTAHALGGCMLALGIFSFVSTVNWLSSLLTLSVGALLLQLGSAPSGANAGPVYGCCGTPGFATVLRLEVAQGTAVTGAEVGCCCGSRVGCSGVLNRIRNVAISAIFFAAVEWVVVFPLTVRQRGDGMGVRA